MRNGHLFEYGGASFVPRNADFLLLLLLRLFFFFLLLFQTVGLCLTLFAPLPAAEAACVGSMGAAIHAAVGVFLGAGGLLHLSADSWTTLHWLCVPWPHA